ncbi:MAG: proline hydroxylase [Rickettsiaceae bacterium]|jgi:Rps23 Pro-64 3,4-dihydroxylase Tpa1-like proline 4-hydroxylase|nr:proline hydroxylase [Rickettsiaceae bacterium]
MGNALKKPDFSDEIKFLPEGLLNKGKDLYEEYNNNSPFPHIVIDNFFDPEILDRILDEFPTPDAMRGKNWQNFDKKEEIKLASRGEAEIPYFTRQFLYNVNSETFLKFISNLTGIPNLIADPYFEGGGLHQIMPGGKLGIHADFNKHSKLHLNRRINMLIYLNKNWKEEYGGCLELWDQQMQNCVKKVLPVFNRVVVFTTDSDSYHGHPDELACPAGMTRKSMALYYYTNEKDVSTESHSTIFRERPGEKFENNTRQKIKAKLPRFMRKYIKSW